MRKFYLLPNCVLFFIASMWSLSAHSDAPTYDQSWQWNNNVKIDFIYGYWQNLPVNVHFDNGEYCFLNSSEKELLSIILTMKAQGSVGQAVCAVTPEGTINGKSLRHLHRIRY